MRISQTDASKCTIVAVLSQLHLLAAAEKALSEGQAELKSVEVQLNNLTSKMKEHEK